MVLIRLLQNKIELIDKKNHLLSKIESNPRQSIKKELERQLNMVVGKILKCDEQFVEAYDQFKSSLKLDSNGDIDVAGLDESSREVLFLLQELITKACVSTNK